MKFFLYDLCQFHYSFIFFQFCHHTEVEEQELSHKLLGLKFTDQVDVLREALINSVPTEFAQQVSIIFEIFMFDNFGK